MNERSDPRLVRQLSIFASSAAAFSALVGSSGLAGWKLHIVALTTWGVAPASMVANTALCFLLVSVSLWLMTSRDTPSFAQTKRLVAKAAAGIAGVAAMLSLAEHAFSLDLGIDQCLLAAPSAMQTTGVRPGLMSAVTAASFLLLSLALLGIDWRTQRGYCPAQFLALAAGTCASFGVLSFAFDPHIYGAHLSLSLPTGVTLCVFSLGLVCSRTDAGLGALLCSRSLGGSMMRRLLPAAMVPVLVGCIRWQITVSGLYSEWSVVVLSSLVTMSLLALLIAWAAVAVDRNDTERRKVEQAREHLAAIVDSSDDAIISKTLAATITAWNRGAEKIFGYTSSEAVGKSMRMLIPPERLDEETDILARIGRGLSVEHFETVRVRKDGRKIDVSVTISPVRDKTGVIVGASKIARDITERKRVETALAAQTEELSMQAEELVRSRLALEAQTRTLQSVLDSMSEGLVAADESGKFTIWNPAAEKIIGLGAADVPTREWCEHYGTFMADTVTLLPAEQNPLALAIQGESNTAELFVRNSATPDGVWIEASAEPVRDSAGVLRGGVVAFRDITQKKIDERQIRQLNDELEIRVMERTAQLEVANKELEAFSYSVSHDLRAPLRHIIGFSKMLVEEFGSSLDPGAHHYLDRIQAGTQKMGLLVDELLNLAKVGRHAINRQATGLNAIVEEVVTMLEPDVQGRAVQWEIADLPMVECDPVLVKQIFQNLLANALKFTRNRTPAIIEVRRIEKDENEKDGQSVFMVRRQRHRLQHEICRQIVWSLPAVASAGRFRRHRHRLGHGATDRAKARRQGVGRRRSRKGRDLLFHSWREKCSGIEN